MCRKQGVRDVELVSFYTNDALYLLNFGYFLDLEMSPRFQGRYPIIGDSGSGSSVFAFEIREIISFQQGLAQF